MHRLGTVGLGTVVLTFVLAGGTAWAQTGDQGGERKSGKQAAPGSGSIPVVSGGISQDARDSLRSQAPPHNVKMVFSLNSGNYLSDVQVKVTDGAGKVVIDDVSHGPWLFAQMPPGNYTATATYAGKPVTQRFSVGKSGVKTAQFRWPASVERAAIGANESEGGGQALGTGPQEPRPPR